MPQHPIAAALGVDEPLSYALITRAVEEHVTENEALDWKRTYPTDGDEFAKDLAAFANSRSGALVYGVAEDRKTSQAAAAMPVDVSDGKRRQLAAWANLRIDPPITGVTIRPLVAEEGDTEGFMVVDIPASPDMPHFIGQQTALGVPYRNGTATAWMRERDIERAYRERFSRRADDQAHLADLINQAVDHLDTTTTSWLVATTVPTTNLDGYLDSSTKAAAVGVLMDSGRLDIGPNASGTLLRTLQYDDSIQNPRRGLRRWLFRSRTDYTPSGLSTWSHVELHHDGSTTLAEEERAHDGGQGKRVLTDELIVGFCLDLVRLICAVNDAAGHTGDTLMRVEIITPPSDGLDAPIAILARQQIGHFVVGSPEQPQWSRDLRRPLPVLATVPRLDTPAERLETARLIAADIANQFGYEVDMLPWPAVGSSDGGAA